MADNSIQARLVIAADVADAIKKLQQIKREAQETGAVVAKVGTGAAGGGAAVGTADRAGAAEARRQAREAAEERKRLAREEAAATAAAAAATTAAQRKANRERIAEEQRVTREVRAATNEQKQAYRQLPAQITDIVTSLVSGQPAYLVAIQQGGQLKDSFGGIVPAAKALLGVLTPLRLVIGGVAAALTALGVASFQGYREQDALNKQLALTGNIAGTSAGQIDRMARSIASSQKAAIGGVRDTLAALLATGNYTSANLDGAARAVTALRKLTGQSAEEAVQAFEAQGEGITAWALKANRAYNFLTAEQLAYVRRLEAEGRTAEAVKLVNEELAGTLEQRSVPAIGSLERAWKRVGAELSRVWDLLKNIGRDDTPEERLAKIQERLGKLRENQASARSDNRPRYQPEIDDLEARERAAREVLNRDQLRAAERAAAQRQEQALIREQSKQYQDALAQVDEAGARKRLAQIEAALAAEAAAVERADATGLQRAEDKALKLNAIEQRRLAAQAALLRRQIEIEQGRVEEKPEDKLAKQARVSALEAELLQLQARIRATVTEAQAIVDAAALDRSREQAQRWAQLWQRAFEQVRGLADQNAASDESGSTQDRADRAAALRAAQLRRDLADLRRDLENELATNTDEPQRALIRQQLRDLEREGQKAIAEQERLGRLGSIVQQSAEALDRLRLAEAEIEAQLRSGALTAEEAEQRKFAARDRALPQLRELLELQRQLARTPGEQNAAAAAAQQVEDLADRTTEAARAMRQTVGASFASVFTDFVTGVRSAGDAFRGFIVQVAQAALNLIAQRLGERIASSLLPSDGGGGILGTIGSFLAGIFHSGGVVGRSAVRVARAVPAAALLAGAQVLHSGGIAGMTRRNEQLAVLEVGEEVLREDDPRHVKNFRGGPVIGRLDVNVDLGDSGAGSAQERVLADQFGRGLRARVLDYVSDEMRPGGLLSRMGRG